MTRMLIAAAALLSAPLLAAPLHGQTAPAQAASPEMEVARRVVARLLPDGIYKQLLGDSMTKLTEAAVGSLDQVPITTLAKIGGLSEEQAQALDQAKMGEIMAIYDPHWKQRMTVTQSTMYSAMGDVFGGMEPRIREAMARAYVREFKLAELQELDRFLSTPRAATMRRDRC